MFQVVVSGKLEHNVSFEVVDFQSAKNSENHVEGTKDLGPSVIVFSLNVLLYWWKRKFSITLRLCLDFGGSERGMLATHIKSINGL